MILLLPSETQEGETKPAELPFETLEDRKSRAARVLECQATSIAWSAAVPGSLGDFSLLVIGHKSGHVSLWRHRAGGRMEILHRFRMDDHASWITALEWSEWDIVTVGGKTFAMACLAVDDSNGSVWSLEVTQDVTQSRVALARQAAMQVDDDASAISAAPPVLLGAPDRRPVSQFRWVVNSERRRRLVYTKVGVVNIVELQRARGPSPSVYTVEKADEVELPAEGAREWMGANPFEPAVGLIHVPSSDSLIVALTSACFYTLSLSGPTPALIEHPPSSDEGGLPTSGALTAQIRAAFIASLSQRSYVALSSRREVPLGAKVGPKTGARITGLASFGPSGEVGWTYEIHRPDQLTYRTNPNIKTTFVVSSIEGAELDAQRYLADLASVLERPPNARFKAPLGLLRSFLHFAHDRIRDVAFVSATLDLVEQMPEMEEAFTQPVEPDEEAIAAAFYRRLYGETTLEGLRLRETIARFILVRLSLTRSHSCIIDCVLLTVWWMWWTRSAT